MVFNSSTFLVFFVAFFLLYWWINNKMGVLVRNVFTTLASYLFYAFWDWRFLSLIIISSLTDYLIGLMLFYFNNQLKRKLLLISSIVINLGILGFFKYFNFFISSLHDLLSLFSINLNIHTLHIILPVGVSFYTFQTLSYSIDIYLKKIQPTKDIFSFFVFVSFFPQLVAGPIERASQLLHQFQEKKIFDYKKSVDGLRIILWGLFKKIVIADNFGILVDNLYGPDQPLSGVTTLLGALFFAFQVYADFSGYSDIAIGLSKMLGFDLMKNFQTPFFSISFQELWQRWHISLSTWFRDYVYIPLGGSRGSIARVNFNLFITFSLSGLWHGANLTFLIWGGLHGVLLIIEKRIKFNINKTLKGFFVFACFVLLLIPFRAENTTHFIQLSGSLFDWNTWSMEGIWNGISSFTAFKFFVFFGVFILFMIIEYQIKMLDFSEWIKQKKKWFRWVLYYTIIFIIVTVGNFDVKPYFIYFQF
ncbi:MAG: MBOAT family protein [Bacteroidales bacterium]|nr:MBOAT family protein [Bacteroidales bacterium]MCF8402416.1 MBOAT family protein [Bacteroidales bacterium]